MSLQHIFDIATYVFLALLVISAISCADKIFYIFAAFLPGKKFPRATRQYKYALLIPARNESKVIEALLKSIEAQTYPSELMDIFVVVEDEKDPTIEICSRYNARVTVRKRLDLKGKGYALDEMLQDMYENGYKNKYDAYFIFDADNYLKPTFMEEMNKAYDAGYNIAVGYRNSKNWNDGWVASCSALSFSILNTFHNKLNSRLGKEMMISGTGFYIDAKIIDTLGGWKFYCLTEDIELSFFSALNNLKSTYCTSAEFYDEQPSKFKVSTKQRTRWLKGYMQASKIYHRRIITSAIKEKGGRSRKISHVAFIIPVIVMVIVVALYAFFAIGLGIYAAAVKNPLYLDFIFTGLRMFGYIYLALFTFNALSLFSELKYIDISFWSAIKTIFFGPIFLFWYCPLFLKAFFKKDVKWEAIEHKVNFQLPQSKK